jgi:hypothetical protein
MLLRRPGELSHYSDFLQVRRCGIRTPVKARFSGFNEIDPEAHPLFCITDRLDSSDGTVTRYDWTMQVSKPSGGGADFP